MKGLGRNVSGVFKKMTGGSSSRSRGGSSSYTPEPQAEVIEIDAEDAPYLDLRDDRERQGYAILKNRSFVHTRAFDPDLLIKTGMYEDFSNVWHKIGWDNIVPVEEYGSRLLTIQFLCTLLEVENGVYF